MYEENFRQHGYDDLDLLRMMDDDEESQMLQILGITLHGHVLKLKKCLRSIRPTPITPETQPNLQGTSEKKVQKQGSKYIQDIK